MQQQKTKTIVPRNKKNRARYSVSIHQTDHEVILGEWFKTKADAAAAVDADRSQMASMTDEQKLHRDHVSTDQTQLSGAQLIAPPSELAITTHYSVLHQNYLLRLLPLISELN